MKIKIRKLSIYCKGKRKRRGRKRKDETNRKIKKNGAKKQRIKSNGILEDLEKEEILGNFLKKISVNSISLPMI